MFASYLLRTTDAEVRLWADVFFARQPSDEMDWRGLLEWTYRRVPRAESLTRDYAESLRAS